MRLTIGLVFATGAFCQTFDVATIKLAPPRDGHAVRVGCTGGPGTNDPGLFTCKNLTLSNLVAQAFQVSFYQLEGMTFGGDMFNISARIPEGATKEQFHLMLQHLLAERFRLASHREKKDVQVYDLVVAKNGPKVKESTPAVQPDAPAGPPAGAPRADKDGYPILSGGSSMAMMNGHARSHRPDQTMQQLAAMLSSQVGKPVTDATGLTGKYDVTLSWGVDDARNGAPSTDIPVATADAPPDIFAALQEQLGLKLEPKKGSVEVLIVDHIDKAPTEN